MALWLFRKGYGSCAVVLEPYMPCVVRTGTLGELLFVEPHQTYVRSGTVREPLFVLKPHEMACGFLLGPRSCETLNVSVRDFRCGLVRAVYGGQGE